MSKLHQKLIQNSHHYEKWHDNPYHYHWHWLTFSLAFLLSASAIIGVWGITINEQNRLIVDLNSIQLARAQSNGLSCDVRGNGAELLPPPRTDYLVSTVGEWISAQNSARPGDVIRIKNGTYTWVIGYYGIDGSASNPIWIVPETPGGVTFTGESFVVLSADWLVFRDFTFRNMNSNRRRWSPNNGAKKENGVHHMRVSGDNVRVERLTILNGSSSGFTHGIQTVGSNPLFNYLHIDGYTNMAIGTYSTPSGLAICNSYFGNLKQTSGIQHLQFYTGGNSNDGDAFEYMTNPNNRVWRNRAARIERSIFENVDMKYTWEFKNSGMTAEDVIVLGGGGNALSLMRQGENHTYRRLFIIDTRRGIGITGGNAVVEDSIIIGPQNKDINQSLVSFRAGTYTTRTGDFKGAYNGTVTTHGGLFQRLTVIDRRGNQSPLQFSKPYNNYFGDACDRGESGAICPGHIQYPRLLDGRIQNNIFRDSIIFSEHARFTRGMDLGYVFNNNSFSNNVMYTPNGSGSNRWPGAENRNPQFRWENRTIRIPTDGTTRTIQVPVSSLYSEGYGADPDYVLGWAMDADDPSPKDNCTVTANSISDLQTKISQASSGDTICLAAGNYNINSTINITNKSITLRGVGQPTLNWSRGSGYLMSIGCASDTRFRITGLAFSGGQSGQGRQYWGSGAIDIGSQSGQTCVDFRIDHNKIEFFDGIGMNVRGAARGVIDANEINNIGTYGIFVGGDGDSKWQSNPIFQAGLGTADAVYVENNIFTQGYWHNIASQNGSRYVFRYNTSIDDFSNREGPCCQKVDAHGKYNNGTWPRGSRSYEIYGNKLISDYDEETRLNLIGIRGGDGVIWGNIFDGSNYRYTITIQNEHAGSGEEDNCSKYAGNRCPDQPRELFIWDNEDKSKGGPVALSNRHPSILKEGTDYFMKSPAQAVADGDIPNTREIASYQPFTCPHPLVDDYDPVNNDYCQGQASGGNGGTGSGDIDKDGDVDIFDYNLLVTNFGSTNCGNVADINGDCKVDIFDYNILIENFGKKN